MWKFLEMEVEICDEFRKLAWWLTETTSIFGIAECGPKIYRQHGLEGVNQRVPRGRAKLMRLSWSKWSRLVVKSTSIGRQQDDRCALQQPGVTQGQWKMPRSELRRRRF